MMMRLYANDLKVVVHLSQQEVCIVMYYQKFLKIATVSTVYIDNRPFTHSQFDSKITGIRFYFYELFPLQQPNWYPV